MRKPVRCDCPECKPRPVEPSPYVTSREVFEDNHNPALRDHIDAGLRDAILGTPEPVAAPAAGPYTLGWTPTPQKPTPTRLTQDARELFARRTVATNHRLGAYIETRWQRRQTHVDYSTPGYQPPEAA